ncbi:hypothetical protein POTG_01173 [Paenibacillus sp. oral taxon 786 str. D14]|nr:hypothetical protein POTG_01173 [Paenibacillus sp. oral taxon 786 str. D14]
METEQQMEHVRRAKCDIIQGYYISKPLPEAGGARFAAKLPA